MPIVEDLEERLGALERILSALRVERIPEVKELEVRVHEQIHALRQLAEQRKRIAEQGHVIGQRLDKTLSQQFSALNGHFEQMEKHFDEIRQNFETSDHFVARTWGLAQTQEHAIREMKGSLEMVERKFDHVNNKMGNVESKLDRVLALLTKPEEAGQEAIHYE